MQMSFELTQYHQLGQQITTPAQSFAEAKQSIKEKMPLKSTLVSSIGHSFLSQHLGNEDGLMRGSPVCTRRTARGLASDCTPTNCYARGG
jgi:hypothetical protein